MAKVTQEFVAVGENRISDAYRKQTQKIVEQEAEISRLVSKLREYEAEDSNLQRKRLDRLSEEIRKTQELKRARGELITSTNWTNARREPRDGRGLVPAPNWSYVPPAAPLRLGYRGDATRDLVAGARHPYFTMEDGDIPRLGYRGNGTGLSTFHQAPPPLQMGNPIGAILARQMGMAGQMLAGMVGVDALIRAFNHQLEQTIERQKNAAAAQKDLASGQAEILLNTFGASKEEQQKIIEKSLEISGKTGLPPGLVSKTLARQEGRGMDTTWELRSESSDIAARIARHNAEQYEPVAGGIQQTMRIGKTDARTAASLFMSGAANTYIGDPTLQARFLTQAISGGVASVPGANLDTLEQVMELGAWVSQEVGEERGEAGRTSIIAALAEMDQFSRGEGPWETASPWGGAPRKRPVKGFPTQPKDRIEFLQTHKAERDRFMRHFSERRLFEGTYQRLFEGGSQQDKNWREMQGRVKPDLGALDQLLTGLEGQTPSLKSASEANKSKVAEALANAGMTVQSRMNEARTIRDDTLQTTSNFPGPLLEETLNWGMRGVADASGFGEIQDRALSDLRRRRNGTMLRAYERTDPEAKVAADLLDRQIKRLEEIRDEIKLLRTGGGKTPSAGPALNGQRGSTNER